MDEHITEFEKSFENNDGISMVNLLDQISPDEWHSLIQQAQHDFPGQMLVTDKRQAATDHLTIGRIAGNASIPLAVLDTTAITSANTN